LDADTNHWLQIIHWLTIIQWLYCLDGTLMLADKAHNAKDFDVPREPLNAPRAN
jgi:hypothetical protein